jgi:outer membrane protein OmpA-like peptidoglycan-associated protein
MLAAPVPTPYVTPSQPPPGKVAQAPVLDISAPVLDLQLPISSLDGSLTNVTGGGPQKIIVAADVLFAFNQATLTPAAKSRIDAAAQTLRAQAKGKKVAIDGYTDAKGSDSYNLQLSQQRADAVRRALEGALQDAGITFAVQGRGEANPVASNTKDGRDNPQGRAKNRRVEISF